MSKKEIEIFQESKMDTVLKVRGIIFLCPGKIGKKCGGNIFKPIGNGVYRCTSCGRLYEGKLKK